MVIVWGSLAIIYSYSVGAGQPGVTQLLLTVHFDSESSFPESKSVMFHRPHLVNIHVYCSRTEIIASLPQPFNCRHPLVKGAYGIYISTSGIAE